MIDRPETIRRLWGGRPRNSFLRGSLVAMLAIVLAAWVTGGFDLGELLSARRLANLERFLGEIIPQPLQGRDFDWQVAIDWAADIMNGKAWTGALLTLAISVAAIVLAAIAAFFLCWPAARNYASPEPFLPASRPPGRRSRWLWWAVVACTRALLIALRAIPEYLWAFLLLSMLGATAWPAVLALAIHNSGILGKLTAETIENVEAPAIRALRGLGAARLQLALFGIFPVTMPRFLLYFFYRWESCVREATVLGMLGIVSLGWWIADARFKLEYDVMLFLVLVGAGIVLIGDMVSAVARRWVRRAS